VTQIGRAYRNEISPRNALVRVREFTQAELELFYDPETDEPDLAEVADTTLRLYPVSEQQADDGGYRDVTVAEAVEDGIIESAWIAYYLGIAQPWFERVGVDMERFRFRQHLPGERAHYAADCWDAEADVSGPDEDPEWIELAGIATRADYDLKKHGAHSDEDFTLFKRFAEPRTVERATVDPDMSALGPEYGETAADIAAALEDVAERDRSAFEGETVTVTVDDEDYEIPIEWTGFAVEEVTETGRQITPHVVEPSFGVGRAVFAALVHGYDEDEVDGEPRTVLRLPPAVAPTFVGVFPLMDKDGMGERARDLAADLRTAGFEVAYDDSGAIGRRYRRQDEIGTPFCVTVDYDTLEDDTVTLRDRDSTEQVRVHTDDLAATLADLRAGERTFGDL
ncbi:MAG: glycine--tRNA ligase, partial [Halodesulfurarchaeum sp.]